jgi:hypothetical protein
MNELTIVELRRFVSYDPSSGQFTRLRNVGGKRAGEIAGCLNWAGYRRIQIENRDYKAHRLAWAFFHGVWPTQQIDHIDGDRDNNAIYNLREASGSDNVRHRTHIQSNNTSGAHGVIWNKTKNKWQARISVNGRRINLGFFDKLESAAKARDAAEPIHHGEFSAQLNTSP